MTGHSPQVAQATVHRFDEHSRTGSVLLDDGTEWPFDADAYAVSGLLRLRFGQRVSVRLDADRVTSLSLATLPLP